MRTVRLPIYEDGTETNEVLEVSVELLQKLGANSIVFKDHVSVVPKETKDAFTGQKVMEVEMETINRIIHGQPPMQTVTYKKQRIHVDPLAQPELPIGAKFDAREERGWRAIPEFEDYCMNNDRKIIDVLTQLEVPVTLGRLNNVLLTNGKGHVKRMSVNHLFQQTFPEIAHPGL